MVTLTQVAAAPPRQLSLSHARVRDSALLPQLSLQAIKIIVLNSTILRKSIMIKHDQTLAKTTGSRGGKSSKVKQMRAPAEKGNARAFEDRV
jgi:hypothetical protein